MLKEFHSTKDYDIFNKCKYNRDVEEMHVNSLMASIKRKNLLHLNPIIVNQDFEVISGQHRLEAAKRLNIPIWYHVDHNVDDDSVLLLNSNQKRASLLDSIKYYAVKQHIPSYELIFMYIKQLDLCPKSAFFLLLEREQFALYSLIKDGHLVFSDLEKNVMEQLAEKYLEFKCWSIENKLRPFSMLKNMTFCMAFRHFLLCDPDMERFKARIVNNWPLWRKQSSVEDFREMFFRIYNKGSHTNILHHPYKK